MTKVMQSKSVSKEQRPAAKPKAKSVMEKAGRAVTNRAVTTRKPGKLDKVIAMMRRPKGATIAELAKATDWQTHSVRGAISGTIKKKQGLKVVSEKLGDARTYRIAG